MKIVTLTTLIFSGLLSLTATAQAHYECQTYPEGSSLTVNENPQSHLGSTSVTVSAGGKKDEYVGVTHLDSGSLFSQTVIDLYPFQGDTLTIISKPKSCGRGSCDPAGGNLISAKLKMGETSAYFDCHETNP